MLLHNIFILAKKMFSLAIKSIVEQQISYDAAVKYSAGCYQIFSDLNMLSKALKISVTVHYVKTLAPDI